MGARAVKQSIVILAVLGSVSFASEPMTVNAYVCKTYPCPPPNKLPVFDDKVFDLTNSSAPTTSTGLAGKPRYLGEENNYNSAQRTAWMKECRPKFYEGMDGFRTCFSAKASEADAAQTKQRDEIEKRQSLPLRNVPPREGKETSSLSRRKKSKFTGMPR